MWEYFFWLWTDITEYPKLAELARKIAILLIGIPMKQDELEENSCILTARSLRIAIIQNLYDRELLTEEEAKELLRSPLVPNNPSTAYDDSDALRVKQ